MGDWVRSRTPTTACIEFVGVSEFRFHPRDPKLPFAEDDCVRTIGFWTDEAWAEGVMIMGPTQNPDPSWRTAIDFMSGAVVIIQAESAHAHIEG